MQTTIEIHGTLHEDGTLELDEKPQLPPGRVKVTVAPAVDLTPKGIAQVLEGIWADQKARGHVPRSQEEIDAELEEGRDDERMREIERIQEECRQFREQQKTTSEEQ